MKIRLFTLITVAFFCGISALDCNAGALSNKPVSGPELLKLPWLIPYRAGNLWGYADSTGTLKIKPQYHSAEPFEDGVARISDSSFWGLIDAAGKEILKPRYKEILPFENGLAYAFNAEDEVGIINKQGREIIPPVYKKILIQPLKDVEQTIILVSRHKNLDWKDQQFRQRKTNTFNGVFTSEGKPILPVIYDEIIYLGEGLFSAYTGPDCTIINLDGTVILPLKTHNPALLKDGLIKVTQTFKSGYIDKTGNTVIPYEYACAADFSEGLAGFCIDKKQGYINRENEVVIPAAYDYGSIFYNGLALVRNADLWGIIDKKGKAVTEIIYNQISFSPTENAFTLTLNYQPPRQAFYDAATGNLKPQKDYFLRGGFRNGLSMAVKTINHNPDIYKKGYVNEAGQIIIPLKYFDATFFEYGLAAVRENELWGVIDEKGKTILPFMFKQAEIIGPDLIKVAFSSGVNGPLLFGLVNTKGEEILPAVYSYLNRFENGLAVVQRNNRPEVINIKGNVVIPAPVIPAGYFVCEGWKNGLLKLCSHTKGKSGFIDRYGKRYFTD